MRTWRGQIELKILRRRAERGICWGRTQRALAKVIVSQAFQDLGVEILSCMSASNDRDEEEEAKVCVETRGCVHHDRCCKVPLLDPFPHGKGKSVDTGDSVASVPYGGC